MRKQEERNINVLIVEDSDVVREKIKELIAEIGNVTVIGEADNKEDAIILGEKHKPDVIILDIRLSGGGTGFPVLRRLKKQLPDVVTIVISNYSAPQYKKRLVELGADYFFDKSNEFEKITQVFSWM